MINNYYFDVKEQQLVDEGIKIRKIINKYKAGKVSQGELNFYVNGVASSTGARIIALNLDEDNNIQPKESMLIKKLGEDKFFDLRDILKGKTVTRKRHFGSDKNLDVVLVGMPLTTAEGKKVEGILLLFSPLTGVRDTINTVNRVVFGTAMAFIIIASLLIFSSARRLTAPLVAMSSAAVRIAEGEEEPDIHATGKDEISNLANSFNYMKNRLYKIENMRRNLISNVSHELRTPLTSIAGFTRAIIDGKVKKEEEEKYLGIVYQEAARLTRLVNDLLLIARVESGNLELDCRLINLPQLMNETIQSLSLEAEKIGVNIIHNRPSSICEVYVDADRIKQVAFNIMGNALKYTPPGGKVEISYKDIEQNIEISFQDTGSGIPPGELEMVFQPFYRSSGDKTKGGTGLGLGIVKQLVQLHGGDVKAIAVAGPGTCIVVSLPRKVTFC
ncbi:MAG: sensor histidine kinase [Chitinophagales bacterium]